MDPRDAAATAHRLYWGRVLSATLRTARDVDIAEEATADAFLLALQTWPERGVPDSVEAWLLTSARRSPAGGAVVGNPPPAAVLSPVSAATSASASGCRSAPPMPRRPRPAP